MIDFEIDIKEKTSYFKLLESLVQQSNALNTIHNPKTWCLSALTYALHLNDCLVLFEDLKRRWQLELPFAEAWDVDFSYWTNEIWSAANNSKCSVENSWKSLCDTDYAHFIELSNKVANGEISITPLIAFVDGKESSIYQIILDAGRKLSKLFSDIVNTINNSDSVLYQTFYDSCIESYIDCHKTNPNMVKANNNWMTYETWAASKTPKKRPEAIAKLMDSIVKEMDGSKTLADVWSDCYEKETRIIDGESIGRNLFINRTTIISNRQYSYQESLDKLFYAVTMLEFLQEKLAEFGAVEKRQLTPEQLEQLLRESNKIFKKRIKGKYVNFTKLIAFLNENAISGITYKNEWTAIYLFCKQKDLLEDKRFEAFAEQMNRDEWFGCVVDRRKCSADSIGDYSFLATYNHERWCEDTIIPTNSKARPLGKKRIIEKYNCLCSKYTEDLIV